MDERWFEPTMIDKHFARLIATFSLLGWSKKSNPLGASFPVLAVKEKIEIGASCPWNLSTVLTLALSFK